MSERLLFLGFCWGAAGTTWLARLLNGHPDIFCMHAPILPRFDHTQPGESAEILDRVFTDHSFGGTYPVVGFTHGIAPEWYDTLTDRYGSQLRCFAVTRHPIRRIQSTFDLHVGLEERLAGDPTWRAAFAAVYEELTTRSGWRFPDDFESLAFYNACAMVNSITWEQEQSFPLFRIEDLSSREQVVEELVAHVSDGTCRLSAALIQQMQQTVVHSHSWRRLSPVEAYEAWRPEHRDAYHYLVQAPALRAYRRLGYELPEPHVHRPRVPASPPAVEAGPDPGAGALGAAAVPDPAAPSPLVWRSLGVARPGVVRLDRMSPWNGATAVAGPPLVATLPRQRWAYGLLFALDHGARGADREPSIAVALELTVEAGQVGIMGVAKGLERATTPETVVGPGTTTAYLLLDPPRSTSTIALRSVGESDTPPRVTVTRVQAYDCEGPCLAPRGHDLGFDLFVVLGPRGTGTGAIESALRALSAGVQVRRLERLSVPRAPGSDPEPARPGDRFAAALKAERERVEAVQSEIGAVRALGARIAFVITTGDPIDLAISAFFEALPSTIPAFAALREAGGEFVDVLVAGLAGHLRRETRRPPDDPARDGDWLWGPMFRPGRFFGIEVAEATGLDLLGHPIDRAAGFTLVSEPGQAVLVTRHEDMPRGLAAGLAALTARPQVAVPDLVGPGAGPGRELALEFRKRFRVDAEVAAEIYDRDPHLRHLYSDAEIAAFKARWTTPSG